MAFDVSYAMVLAQVVELCNERQCRVRRLRINDHSHHTLWISNTQVKGLFRV